jgi:ArsR family transcriptional regulator
MASFEDGVRALRAAAEPTRLRILAVCAEGELTVGEIGEILAQSQPRVSRHLKLLCDAGLLLRFRESHWVYYRVPAQGQGADHVAQLLAWIEVQGGVVQLDRQRAAAVRDERARLAAEALAAAADEATDAELQAALLEELGDAPLGALLDIGTGTGRILQWLAPRAREATGVDLSTEALRVARTSVHGAGLHHCTLQQADMHELPFDADSFDVITIDRVLVDARSPVLALKEAARLLRHDGRLLVIEDYDKLDATSPAADRHALRNLRDWLDEAGFEARRLRPLDIAGRHLLIALSGRRRALTEAA